MRTAGRVVAAVVLAVVLGGCVAAAVVPLMYAGYAVSAFVVYKTVQLSTGGSIEVGIDDSKLTNEQKSRLSNIRSMAVWPDKNGSGAVTFAEALMEGSRLEVITPSQVAGSLKKLNIGDSIEQMTKREATEAFSRVCRDTRADSIIVGRITGGKGKQNTFSLEAAAATSEGVVMIYDEGTRSNIAELPFVVKVTIGGTTPSGEEISRLANNELAKKVIELTQNPSLPNSTGRDQKSENGDSKSTQSSGGDATRAEDPSPMTVKELQERLLTLGYSPGAPDGVMGKKTANALKSFQKDSGIAVTGIADPETVRRLRGK